MTRYQAVIDESHMYDITQTIPAQNTSSIHGLSKSYGANRSNISTKTNHPNQILIEQR